MAIDGIFLHFLTEELCQKLIMGRVDKIYQTQKTELVFSIKTREDRFKLLISASGNCPRIHITDTSIENPPNPPMLCMLLRKQLSGAFLESIEQVGLDRIVKLNFLATNELGDKCRRTLIVEIMAQYSNIILVDENGKIIDSVKRVDQSKSSFRNILPGLMYENPPAQDKKDIRNCDIEKMILSFKDCGASSVQKQILNTFQGICPVVANEISFRCGCENTECRALTDRQTEKLIFEMNILKNKVVCAKATPTLIYDCDSKPKDLSYISFTLYGNDFVNKPYPSFSELTDDFYREKEQFARTKTKAADLFHQLTSLIDRTSRRLDAQRVDLKNTDKSDEKRIFGELINANLFNLEKGKTSYVLQNFYDDYKTVSIPVDPQKNPSQNAQKYFKEYKKLTTAHQTLTKLIEDGEDDLLYLQTVLDSLSRAENEKEINEIRSELRETGFLKSQGNQKKLKSSALPPLKFKSPSGFDVFVGRNNIQNDKLSLKTADKNDLWFHIQKAPGSHVVLHNEGNSVTDDDIRFCCQTAAYYSSARFSGRTEIDCTEVKNLKKPNGAKPGFVIYYVYESYSSFPKNPEDTNQMFDDTTRANTCNT